MHKKHSETTPSSAERWTNCFASITIGKHIEDEAASEYAIEGNAAHDLAEWSLDGLKTVLKKPHDPFDYPPPGSILVTEGKKEFKIEITDEMSTAVKFYVDYIVHNAKGAKLNVEKQIKISEKIFGTVDVSFIVDDDCLHVYDFKYGKGIEVEAKNNKQILIYAGGVLQSLGKKADKIKTVKLAIVQPRIFYKKKVKVWKITKKRLQQEINKIIKLEKERQKNPWLFVTGEHCRWCKVNHVCPQQYFDFLYIEKLKNKYADGLQKISIKEILKVLDMKTSISTFLNSVAAFAQNKMESGFIVPGWKLVQKRATRKWKQKDQKMFKFLISLGLEEKDIYEPNKIKSPAQIYTLVKDKEARKKIDTMTVKESSGLRLDQEKSRKFEVDILSHYYDD